MSSSFERWSPASHMADGFSVVITNSFDAVGRLTGTWLRYGATLINSNGYTYNVGGQRTAQQRSEGVTVDYTYDELGQLKTALANDPNGTNRLHERLCYHYDAAGNLQRLTNGALVRSFGVNALNELTEATRSGTLTVAGYTTTAATDVTVNGSTATQYADQTFASAGHSLTDGVNTFTAIAQASSGRKSTNTVTAYLPATGGFSYDLNGNLLSDGLRAFDYDDENQLIRVLVTNAWKSEFVYDGKLRRRVRKEYTWQSNAWVQTNEVRYVYDGNLVLQERHFDPQLSTLIPQQLVSYTRGLSLGGGIGGLLARTDGAGHAYYHADGGGNITALINANADIVARYLYDPYGNTLAMSGPLAEANRYRFSSKEVHPTSGLYYYGYRFYEPNLQRWLNQDPIGEAGGINLYGFVGNGPVMNSDPYGLDWQDYIPKFGESRRERQGQAGLNAMLSPRGYGSMQQYFIDQRRPVSGMNLTAGNLDAVQAGAHAASGATHAYLDTVQQIAGAGIVTRTGPVAASRVSEAVGEAGWLSKLWNKCKFWKKTPKPPTKTIPELRISASEYPELAENILHAQKAGHPSVLTHGGDIAANRAAALKDVPNIRPFSRDEYPFASSLEGGGGSWIGHIPVSQQNAQGALLKNFFKANNIKAGDQYRVIVDP